MSRYIHLAHLRDAPLVKAGQYIHRGDLLGYVGSTGFSTGPHCHFEVHIAAPTSLYMYPNDWSIQQTKNAYQDPTPFVKDGYPIASTRLGLVYLQKSSLEPKVFHPGIDLIAPSGTPIYAPCNGRVQFVEGGHWIRNTIGKLIPSFYNHGFGNHIYIECDEAHLGL